ncbi:MAG: hypothetical protein ACFFAI_11685 [Promethearchaeota archaeon]
MIDKLYNIFSNLELSWIDSYSKIDSSKDYLHLISIFPNLEQIFQDGNEREREEFQRTVRHIFRLFKIFFLIKKGEFVHETLSQESLNVIREKLLKQDSQNELIIPIILMYHDIGRLVNKKDHPFYSYQLISDENLLDLFSLSSIEKLLINKVIQYHLLFATIYTGESTFYGVYSLLNDTEINEILVNTKYINKFIDLLEIFTYIDILGYSYARIYDHYISYYDEINTKLKDILSLWSDKEKALKLALNYSREWIEWRIAGSLRIFQYINTQPYLTKDFYFERVKESINVEIGMITNTMNWDVLVEKYLINTMKIQIKYGLAMLMLLAFDKFFRGPIREDDKISNNLILFWILLAKEIEKRTSKIDEHLWNVHFTGLPNWFKWDRKFKKDLNYQTLRKIIENSSQNFNNKTKEFNLYLNFSSVFN